MAKKISKVLLALLFLILLVLGAYVGYLYIAYDRLPDKQKLTIEQESDAHLKADVSYRAMTYNIGYGSYPPSYSFFMDGGKKSRADSKASVEKNLRGVVETTEKIDPSLAFYQEVDEDGDRSQHVNEVNWLRNYLLGYNSLYGQNYDSPYLFYPFNQPIGKAKSGLITMSKAEMTDAKRYSLPIETNYNKFLDLDRAFTTTKIPVEGSNDLIAINVHLSAYTKDKSVQEAQLSKLFNYMEDQYKKGNYVIVGGDFNHDVLGNSPEVFGTSKKRESWNQPFPKEDLPKGFEIPVDGLAKAKIPSSRKLDAPYDKETAKVTLIDGFIVSDNVSVEKVQVEDNEFKYSDHQPVYLDFKLKK
ncbi:endonuclease/exonuclease/phosphatase family protein [Candidatus Enterococcus ferrettii]|uniref:Hydrolase n=1 Tax=Candidatus Enterococcus ferrettii TaxID=2815324 RepID=A0ABV0ETB2_9ENTE|nr:endonuclease/exonuclease/phosphatase family protein [Enterococcus sp. 665A]MBO1339810.1 hydrolase [Enterococcus sp. 665A]